VILCDVRRSFLPLKCWEFGRSDGREFSTEIEYATYEIGKSSHWFPSSIEFKSWGIGGASSLDVGSPLSEGWFQRFLFNVSDFNYDVDVTDTTFEIKPPDGDSESETAEYIGDPPGKSHEMTVDTGGHRNWWSSQLDSARCDDRCSRNLVYVGR